MHRARAAAELARGAPGVEQPHHAYLPKVDIRLPGKVNSNSLGARPVHEIISMIKWIRTRRLSIKNSLSRPNETGTPSRISKISNTSQKC